MINNSPKILLSLPFLLLMASPLSLTAASAQGYLPPSQNNGRNYTEPGEYDYRKPTQNNQGSRYQNNSRPDYNRPPAASQYDNRPPSNQYSSQRGQNYNEADRNQNGSSYYGIPGRNGASSQDRGYAQDNPRPNYNQPPRDNYADDKYQPRQDAQRGAGRDYQAPPSQQGDNGYRGRPPYRDQKPFAAPRMAQGYSESEIKSAGHRFFGNITTGLAKVIAKAFKRSGRPNGYILGEEGSGAFIAGLRYGEGRLHTKHLGEHPIFWQGPSIGYDFGASGSKTMILVYNLKNIDFIYQKFGGVTGSAYVVGGVGITLQKRDDVTMAPIRSGVGLRLGANIGYLKYTRKPTWNPF